MKIFHAVETEHADQIIEARGVIRFRFQRAAFPRVHMPEIHARRKHFIDHAKIRDLFHRTDLRQFSHRFGAEFDIGKIVHINIIAQNFQPFFRKRHRFAPFRFSLRRRVKHHAMPAHQPRHACALQYVFVRFRRHLVGRIREIDEIRRVHGNFYPLRLERLTDRFRFFFGHANASAERIFKAIQSSLFYVFCRLFRMRIPFVVKTLRIAARAEFNHRFALSFYRIPIDFATPLRPRIFLYHAKNAQIGSKAFFRTNSPNSRGNTFPSPRYRCRTWGAIRNS